MELFKVSKKENFRSQVLQEFSKGNLTRSQASKQLGISLRQLDRIKLRFAQKGLSGLVHLNRGKSSNRAMLPEKIDEILDLVKRYYPDFKPTLASEKLWERHGIKISREKLRLLMISAGIWQEKKRRGGRAYQRRSRRSRIGELLQGDASPHDWFEERGPKCDLVSFIDDATGLISARFEPSETTEGYMRLFSSYIKKNGCPKALYVDKSAIFRVNHGKESERKSTVFGRILKELGIELICAHSPQAKGRVERMYSTFQDRVIKEMRLAGVSSLEEGNEFLKSYLPIYNERFSKEAANSEDAHFPISEHLNLYEVFTRREERRLSKSLDFSFQGTIYQIVACSTPRRIMNQKLIVFTALDGEMWIECLGQRFEVKAYNEIAAKPQEMDRKQLNAWLNRKTPITVKQRLARKIAMSF